MSVSSLRPRSLVAAALLGLFASGCQSIGSPAPSPAAGSRPNIVFIFSDDHAPHAISAYGSKINKTPNIDRLAAQGMLFTNCFCGNSICGPSRATILSGKHTHANGFMRNGNRFDPSQPTFPKMLQKIGYTTAMIGKWHLTSNPTGFDHWMVLPGQGDYYNPDFITPQGKKRLQGYCTDITTDLALNWLRSQRDPNKPFVLMCQHKAPHRSWMPGPEELALYRGETIPEPATLFDNYAGRGRAAANQEMEIDRHMYMYYDLKLEPNADELKGLQGPDRSWPRMRKRLNAEQLKLWDSFYRPENAAFRKAAPTGKDLVRWKYQRYIQDYLRCVAGVDKSVGALLDYIDADPKLRDNTIVIYSSDQGFYLGDHGWYDKRWMYEESLRMPFVVRWPKHIQAGQKSAALIQNIDFGPTFLEAAGAPIPDDVHGESILPILTGDGSTPEGWRDAVYYHYYESHAVHMVGAHYGVRTDRYKLMYFYDPENRYWELFDLETDPDERTNVYDDPKYADVRAGLKKRLKELRKQYADDTGLVGDFDYAAGVARAVQEGDGWRIRPNAWGTYLTRKAEKKLAGKVSFSTTIRPESPGKGRGMIVFTGGLPRARLFRAGIDFAKKQLIVVGPRLRDVERVSIEIPPGDVAVTVQANLQSGFSVTACGKLIQKQLPKEWAALSTYGYGLDGGTMVFGGLKVRAQN